MPALNLNLGLISVACALTLIGSGFVWQKSCKRPPVWIKQLNFLGKPRKEGRLFPGVAVICGGSVAGILAARICADHFERVVIVDPDIEHPEKERTRIVQWNAAHVYLCVFVEGVRRLWPNFDQEVVNSGGRIAPTDLQLHYSGIEMLTPYLDYPAGDLPQTVIMRRSTAQKVMHKLLLQTMGDKKNITLVPGTVRSIRPAGDMSNIESVVIRKEDGTQLEVGDIALVLDCTGRTQAGCKWLQSAGYDIPASIRCSYNPHIHYLTFSFPVTPELVDRLPIPPKQEATALLYVYIPHDDTTSCFTALVINDNNILQLFIGDSGMGDLPRDSAEIIPFLQRYRGFNAPIPAWFIECVEILVDYCGENWSIDSIKLAPLQYLRYHLLPVGALPSNFITVGDAGLFLNPVHGQGFAKAMLNGIVLNSLLHTLSPASSRLPYEFAARYFKLSAACIQGLWDATRLHDYGSANCEPMEGESKETGRYIRWFENKLVSAATQDGEVASALWHVRQLLAADRILFAPTILWKVFCTRSLFV